MIGAILQGVLANIDPKIKSSLSKIKEFMPMIKGFHDVMPIDKSKHELGIGYLIRFEQIPVKDSEGNETKEKEAGIVLYQCALASNPEVLNSKIYVSRVIEKWNVTEKINEIVND